MNAMVRIEPQITDFEEAEIAAALEYIPKLDHAKYRVFGYHPQCWPESRNMYLARIERTKTRDRMQGSAVETDEGKTMIEQEQALSDDERETYRNALGDAVLLINDAGAVFELLESGMSGGFLDGDNSSIMAVMRMSARAIRDAQARELDVLGDLEVRLMRPASH